MPDSSPPPPSTASSALPVHGAALDEDGHVLRVRRGPGRPKRARPAPDADAVAYKEEMLARLDRAVADDEIVMRVSEFASSASTPDLISSAIEATARELASIAWETRQHPDSRDGERRRSRRVDGLVMLARMVLDLRRLTGAGASLRHPGVGIVLEAFLREVDEAASAAMSDDLRERFVGRVRERLEGWEERFQAQEMRRQDP